jgi:hypothetical protein
MTAPDWKRIAAVGFVAGIVFAITESGFLIAFGFDPLVVVRMTAALVMGRGVLPPPATFEPTIMLVAILVHFGLSIAIAFAYARFIAPHTEAVLTAILGGGAFGFALHAFNLYVMTLVFPWFMDGRSWQNVLAHVLFGAVLGLGLRPHDKRFAL